MMALSDSVAPLPAATKLFAHSATVPGKLEVPVLAVTVPPLRTRGLVRP